MHTRSLEPVISYLDEHKGSQLRLPHHHIRPSPHPHPLLGPHWDYNFNQPQRPRTPLPKAIENQCTSNGLSRVHSTSKFRADNGESDTDQVRREPPPCSQTPRRVAHMLAARSHHWAATSSTLRLPRTPEHSLQLHAALAADTTPADPVAFTNQNDSTVRQTCHSQSWDN